MKRIVNSHSCQMDKDHSKHICWLVFNSFFFLLLICQWKNPSTRRDFYGLEGYCAWFSFSLLVNFAILQLADVCDAPKKSYYHRFILFPFFHCLSWFVFLSLYDNLADVLDAPLKVGSNFGWAVLARSPHKSHITTTLHTESLCPLWCRVCAGISIKRFHCPIFISWQIEIIFLTIYWGQ